MAVDQRYVRVNVMVDRSFASTMAERLGQAGFQIEQSLEPLSIITGRILADRMDDLAAIEGVLAVERDRTVGILDPGLDDDS